MEICTFSNINFEFDPKSYCRNIVFARVFKMLFHWFSFLMFETETFWVNIHRLPVCTLNVIL